MLPSGGYPREPSLGLSALDPSTLAVFPVVVGGECKKVLGWFPLARVDMGVLGGVDRGEALVRTFLVSNAT